MVSHMANTERKQEENPGAIRTRQGQAIQSAATAENLHSKGKRETVTDLDSRAGGQDTAESYGHAAQRDL